MIPMNPYTTPRPRPWDPGMPAQIVMQILEVMIGELATVNRPKAPRLQIKDFQESALDRNPKFWMARGQKMKSDGMELDEEETIVDI